MIEKKLEIALITYNRSKYLENTLSQVVESPFATCKITILDNHSTDNTQEVCKKYQKLFPNMTIIRHEKNIGGNANILRAVETSKSLYTWILCDDDEYDFTDCDDVIEAIKSEEFDIIISYSDNYKDSEKKTIVDLLKEKQQIKKDKNKNKKYNYYDYCKTSGRELFGLMGRYYFGIIGFVPAMIYKTELFDSELLIQGYDNIYNMFPHYPLIYKSLENNVPIYKSKKDILTRFKDNEVSYSSLRFFNGWFESSLLIKNQSDRKIIATGLFKASFLQILIYSIIRNKIEGSKEEFRNEMITLTGTILKVKGTFKGILYIILSLLISLIPKKLGIYLKVKMEKIRTNLDNNG